MKTPPREDLLDVIGCEIGVRPDAPGIEEIVPYLRGADRTTEALTLRFEPDALPLVEAFAAAERVCCAGIGWEVEGGPPVTLRISAAEPALDVIQQLINSAYIDASQ